jgi:hypothetical protein
MATLKSQSAGGKATAIKLRKQAIDRYYDNPNKCLYCGSIIHVADNEKVGSVRAKKFCDHSCCAKYNNNLKGFHANETSICKYCGIIIKNKLRKSGKSFVKREVCDGCKRSRRVKELSARHHNDENAVDYIGNRSKEEIFSGRKNWQSARSSIRRHAEVVYRTSESDYRCEVCGYTTYVEICHIKSVSSFPDDTIISEINSRDNLIGLCPNHHWEFDHGKLDIRGRTSG